MTDNTEKSTGRTPYTAMRSMNVPMMVNAARRAL